MRVRWFIGLSAVLLAVVGVTVVAYEQTEGSTGGDDQVVEAPGDGSTSPGVPAGALEVSGTITALHLEGAVLEPRLVPTPLTLTADRGFGNGGELTGVSVGGRPSAVVWDGGRPFVLRSGPGLVLDPADVELVPEGLRVALGGGAHALEPGEYRLETPVAVGQAGVATPYDAVTFTAGPDAQLEADGDTSLLLGPDASRRFGGPGTARLEGDLRVRGTDGERPAAVVEVTGPFDLELVPAPGGGWTVAGVIRPAEPAALTVEQAGRAAEG